MEVDEEDLVVSGRIGDNIASSSGSENRREVYSSMSIENPAAVPMEVEAQIRERSVSNHTSSDQTAITPPLESTAHIHYSKQFSLLPDDLQSQRKRPSDDISKLPSSPKLDESLLRKSTQTTASTKQQQQQQDLSFSSLLTIGLGETNQTETFIHPAHSSGEGYDDDTTYPPHMVTQLSTNDILELKSDKLTAKYLGKGRHSYEAGTLRSCSPWKACKRIHYYEVHVANIGARGQIYIGLSDSSFSWNKSPGHYLNSFGYRSDDGKKVYDKGHSDPYATGFNSGDVVGCGYDFLTGTTFFTLNGKHLGVAFQKLSGEFFPTVSMRSTGDSIRVNLGASRFIFDIHGYIKGEDHSLTQRIRNTDIQRDLVRNFVTDYLAFQGHHQSLDALKSAFQGAPTSSKPRDTLNLQTYNYDQVQDLHSLLPTCLTLILEVRVCIQSGNVEEALLILRRHFSARPHKRPKGETQNGFDDIPTSIYLPLKCQAFIEVVRQRPSVEISINHVLLELVPLRRFILSPTELDYLEKCITLIAYSDPHDSPFKWLLEDLQRERVADLINGFLVECLTKGALYENNKKPLFFPSSSGCSLLETVLKHLGVSLSCYIDESRKRKGVPGKVASPEPSGPSSSFAPVSNQIGEPAVLLSPQITPSPKLQGDPSFARSDSSQNNNLEGWSNNIVLEPFLGILQRL